MCVCVALCVCGFAESGIQQLLPLDSRLERGRVACETGPMRERYVASLTGYELAM